VKTQAGLEVITYGEFNRVSHYTANVSAAADCFRGYEQSGECKSAFTRRSQLCEQP
jgi:hypothetical protein